MMDRARTSRVDWHEIADTGLGIIGRCCFALAIVLFVLSSLTVNTTQAEEYSREAFGGDWLDLDGDGVHTRDEMLAASMFAWRGWYGLYSGRLLANPDRVDIDHVVPLKWAWLHGADEWDADLRAQFANDPDNLIAVHRSTNRSKGSRGPDQWMPTNVAVWPIYLDRFERVASRYGLTLSADDAAAISVLQRFADDHALGIKTDRVKLCP